MTILLLSKKDKECCTFYHQELQPENRLMTAIVGEEKAVDKFSCQILIKWSACNKLKHGRVFVRTSPMLLEWIFSIN